MSQVFKKKFNILLLSDLLNLNCSMDGNNYIWNTESFKKGMYNHSIEEFILKCKEFYHVSKYKYLEINPITHKSFATILRQICKKYIIPFTIQIKYLKSTYEIIYSIQFIPSEHDCPSHLV